MIKSRFASLFRRQVLRWWGRHPVPPVLNILGVATGVAVFLAIQTANTGALASFRNAVDLVAGRAHLEVRGNLPEEIFPLVAATGGVREATPLVEGLVTLPDEPGEYLRVIGIDPFTGTALRAFDLLSQDGSAPDLEHWLRGPRVIAAAPARGLASPVRVVSDGTATLLEPVFQLVADDALVDSDPRTVAMDIGWTQELLGRQGRLTSIQMTLDDPLVSDAVVEALRAIVPPDAIVAPPSRRGGETEQMLAAFQLNLTALSLVSMVVGAFLIYNSLSAAVVRRRHEIGILRANGATRAEVTCLFLGDGLLCGLAGTLLGILVANPLALLLAAPVGETISSLYTLVAIERLAPTPSGILLALAAGLGTSLLAAWRPAREAALEEPASVLRQGSRIDSPTGHGRKWTIPASILLVISFLLSWWSMEGGPRVLGFAAVGFLIAGFTLFVPAVAGAFASNVRGPGWVVRLSALHLGRSLHRNAVTIAALAIAVAMTVSVSVMIFSFRASVTSWLSRTLVADLFIAPAANEIVGLETFLPDEAVAMVSADPRVAAVGTFREIRVPWGEATATLAVLDGNARGELEFLDGPRDAADRFRGPGAVAVSESFANRHGVEPGERLEFLSPGGPAVFEIAGVVRDFTRDSGLVMIGRNNFERHWDDRRLHSLSITMVDTAGTASLARDFRARFSENGEFSIYTNSDLRGRVLEIFDRTFAVTSVLRAISVVVAVAGVFLSLTVLVMEREREIGILRSQGASRRQVRGLVFTEAAMLGLLASVVGVACGACMAMILTWVVNKAFFGWTIELRYPVGVLLATPFWIIPAAVLAAWLPALRASRIAPARALRFE